jgi:3-deoxy-D-manno-octulosonic acid kinase
MPGLKSLDNQFKIKKTGNSYILYDASIIADPVSQLFDRDYHTNQSAQQNNSSLNSGSGVGRARVVYFSFANKTFVLKHYYRGGAVALILKDQYFGFNIEKTRAFREWRLLKKMRQLGLPVPEAVAAHVKKGLFYYRADLITEKIENTKTLADVLIEKLITTEQWKKIGACIRLFHQHNIYHADLNARNIMLTESGDVYLIDFDNSDFRVNSQAWKMANLSRLKRSLLKFKSNEASFNFNENNWSDLMNSYKL